MRLDEQGVANSGIIEDEGGLHLNAKDPDNIALEFFYSPHRPRNPRVGRKPYGLGGFSPVLQANRHGIQEGISSDNELTYGHDLFTEMRTLLTVQRGSRSRRSTRATLTCLVGTASRTCSERRPSAARSTPAARSERSKRKKK